ncbi:MAG: PmoA family protein [Chthoniobacteraceae bacterium]
MTRLLLLSLPTLVFAAPKPVPHVQALPQPHAQISFQREGVEIARYHYGDDGNRPFVFPIIGPSGRPLTRMGHPQDPQGHSHHNSVWLSHQFVNGENFWGDTPAHVVHQRMLRIEDGDDSAAIETENAWTDKAGVQQMHELRRTKVQLLADGEWLLFIDAQFEARKAPVELAQTAFGMMAVRMAKTIGVRDGGGTIRNSEGGVDEAGVFRKPARWCDYSGPILNGVGEGITLMDHPANLNHPVPFHVRDDGWMGASLTFAGPHTIEIGKPLRLRYALYIHRGIAAPEKIEAQWKKFAAGEWEEIGKKR